MRTFRFRFSIIFACLLTTNAILANENVENFSLDSSVSPSGGSTEFSNASGLFEDSGSNFLNDYDSGSNLFGDSIPNVPMSNSGPLSGATENSKASVSLGGNPGNASKDKFSQDNSVSDSSGAADKKLSLPEASDLQTAGEQLPSGAGQNSGSSEANLTGDGSLAPVINPEYLPPVNEFGGVPPLPGTRRDMAPGEAPELYRVEEGDTMFDVCSQLIDDGNYWPKLWSLNPEVRNPHFIYPGMKLAFYSGDTENPPFIEVVTEDELLPVEKGEINEADLVVEAEVISDGGQEGGSAVRVPPPPSSVISSSSTVSDDVVEVVSPSDVGAEMDVLDGFIFAGRRYQRDDVDFIVPAFIFSEEREPLAEVVSGVSGELMFANERTVLLRPESEMGVGSYSILRPSGEVESLRTGEYVGYRYEFAGNVRVVRRTKAGLLEGTVFDSRTPIRVGDIAVKFLATKRNIPSAASIGPVSPAKSSVLGFQDAGRSTGSKGDFVFLEKSGVSVGGFYPIFRIETNRTIKHVDDEDILDDAGSVAVVRVVDVSGDAALGYIVGASSEVKIGDTLSF
jgi:hypothetical protein